MCVQWRAEAWTKSERKCEAERRYYMFKYAIARITYSLSCWLEAKRGEITFGIKRRIKRKAMLSAGEEIRVTVRQMEMESRRETNQKGRKRDKKEESDTKDGEAKKIHCKARPTTKLTFSEHKKTMTTAKKSRCWMSLNSAFSSYFDRLQQAANEHRTWWVKHMKRCKKKKTTLNGMSGKKIARFYGAKSSAKKICKRWRWKMMRKQTKQKSLTLGACFSFHLIRIKAHSIFCALCPHSSYFVGLNRQIAIKKPNTHDSNCEKQANYSSNNKYNEKKKIHRRRQKRRAK